METTHTVARRPVRLPAALLALLLGVGAGSAEAQITYRWVDKSGRVVVSDTAPPKDARDVVVLRMNEASTPPARFDVRTASGKYPVVLYTASECGDRCDQAKALLSSRGIPFAERPVRSEADLHALKQLTNDPAVPTLTVGREVASGFHAEAWNDLLDLAGYPKTK